MARKRKQMGWKRKIKEWRGIPVHVGDHSSLNLTWYEAPETVIRIDGGRKKLWYRDGFITDGMWALVFAAEARRSARPKEYELYWAHLLYGGDSLRKTSLTITMTDLCELRVTENDQGWQPHVAHARFNAIKKDGRIHIELDYDATVVLLHRCFGRVMEMHAKRVKDSPIEPYRRLLEFLAAMDYDNFGLANGVCAVNYEHAMNALVPQPFCGDCFDALGRHNDLDHPRRRRIPTLDQQASQETLRRLIDTPETTRIIYVEEIGADVLRHKTRRRPQVGTSPSAIRRRITNLGLRTIAVRGVGIAITVADYNKYRDEFLDPRDRRTRLPSI